MDLPYPYHRSLSPVDKNSREGGEDHNEKEKCVRLAESQNQNIRSMSSSLLCSSLPSEGSEGADVGEVPKTNDYNYNHSFDNRSAVSRQSLDVPSYGHSLRSSPSHTSASQIVSRQLFQRFRKLLPFLVMTAIFFSFALVLKTFLYR